MRALEPNDQTGDLSWPLVERRQKPGSTPDGVDRRTPQTSEIALMRRFIRRLFRRAGSDPQRRQTDQVQDLIAANHLLVSLQKIALTLPAALDLEQVLDQSSQQVRDLISADVITILMSDNDGQVFTPVRGRGSGPRIPIPLDELPRGVRRALSQNFSTHDQLDQPFPGFAEEARLGAYCALRSRRHLVGVIAVEWRDPRKIDQELQILTALADSLGVALDNALLFNNLRLGGANDERRRIARELHDRTGSTLAFVGFEIDRLIRSAESVHLSLELESLRGNISLVIGEVREMLFDLRSGDDGRYSLRDSIIEFLDRVQSRSPIDTSYSVADVPKLDDFLTNELWEITKEAILNAERHSRAKEISVSTVITDTFFEIRIQDDGCGFDESKARADSYGLRGMAERSDLIGANLLITVLDAEKQAGTLVRIEVPTNQFVYKLEG